MKANELMIGDWVHVEAHRGFYAQNVKVETIPDNDGDNEYGHHYGHIGAWLEGGDNDFRDVEAKHLQPIPLTCSVLEKIGFEEMMNEGEEVAKRYGRVPHPTGVWQLGLSDFDCVMYVPKDDFLRIKFMMAGQTDLRNIRFVHELQHALRLCGIEKEIVL